MDILMLSISQSSVAQCEVNAPFHLKKYLRQISALITIGTYFINGTQRASYEWNAAEKFKPMDELRLVSYVRHNHWKLRRTSHDTRTAKTVLLSLSYKWFLTNTSDSILWIYQQITIQLLHVFRQIIMKTRWRLAPILSNQMKGNPPFLPYFYTLSYKWLLTNTSDCKL